MKWVRRLLALLLLLALAAGVGSYVWVTWYIQSGGLKAEIELRLSDLVQAPVHLSELTFVPVRRLEAAKAVIPTGRPDFPEPVVEVPSLAVDFNWRELTSGALRLEKLDIDSPVVLLREDKAGEVVVAPWPPEGRKKDAAPASLPAAGPPPPRLEWAIRKAAVSDGSLTYVNRTGVVTLKMRGIEADAACSSRPDGDFDARGQVEVAAIRLVDKIDQTGFSSPFELSREQFHLSAFTASAYSGTLSGQAMARIREKGTPYEGNLRIEHLDLRELAEALGGKPQAEVGKLHLTFSGNGRLEHASAVRGHGKAEIGPVASKGVPMLGALGTLIGLPTLDDIRFEKIAAYYRVEGEKVIIDGLRTEPTGQRIDIIGAGTIDFDGKIEARGEASISSGLAGAVTAVVKTLLLKSSKDFLIVPFRVTGSVGNPKVEIHPLGVGESILEGILDFIPLVPTAKIFESALRKHVDKVFEDGGRPQAHQEKPARSKPPNREPPPTIESEAGTKLR